VGAAFFLVYPFVFSIALSVSDLENNNFTKMFFVGLANYKKAFVTDVEFVPKFLTVVTDTLINTPMIVIFAFLTAIMVSRDIKGKGIFRALFFLPVLLGTGFVMQQLQGQSIQSGSLEVARGILLPEKLQAYLGYEITGYITAFFNRITIVMWGSGVQIVIMLAGIQSIAPALYEVARVDGATEWEMFWKITLPMSAPILLLCIVYTIAASFTGSSQVVDYIISLAFGTAVPQFAYSAAMGWIYFLFVLAVILLVFLMMRRPVNRVAQR
jgi:ABC-type sugar transport system permease subunit